MRSHMPYRMSTGECPLFPLSTHNQFSLRRLRIYNFFWIPEIPCKWNLPYIFNPNLCALKKHKKSVKSEFPFFLHSFWKFLIANLCFSCCVRVILLQFTYSHCWEWNSERERARGRERGRLGLPASTHYHWLTHSSNSCSLGCWQNFLHRLKHKVFAELPSIFSLFPLICTQPFISLFLLSPIPLPGIETRLHEK